MLSGGLESARAPESIQDEVFKHLHALTVRRRPVPRVRVDSRSRTFHIRYP